MAVDGVRRRRGEGGGGGEERTADGNRVVLMAALRAVGMVVNGQGGGKGICTYSVQGS